MHKKLDTLNTLMAKILVFVVLMLSLDYVIWTFSSMLDIVVQVIFT